MQYIKYKKIRSAMAVTLLFLGLLVFGAPAGTTYAAPMCPNGAAPIDGTTCVTNGKTTCVAGYELKGTTCVLNPTPTTTDTTGATSDSGGTVTDPAVNGGNCASVSKCDLVSKWLNPFINFLAALVGIVVVISIVIGGIQYGSSAGDPQQVSAAKNRIRNAIIALVTFVFLYALLNFLIPGGLL
jgi:hypothetical protein